MKVVEKFVSINGESTRAGELAVFIRFKGCNLSCSYCDTMWANEKNCPYTEMSPEEILNYVRETGVTNVTLTGGEPLLQDQVSELIELLLDNGNRVEIETNGSIDLKPFITEKRPVFTMDYKLPGSRCEKSMLIENFSLLEEQDTVKFVSGSIEDLDKARSIIETYDLCRKCHTYISPVFGSIEPSEIVDYMIQHNMNEVRLQIQMHKVIWDPDKRGV
ncbi:putative 7-carboxy-7-deazaguanine synthase QueE [Oribacterium sp. WCC10]|uniref:putative 7-carboxy-7-deazaguanine synthase QueE n=1 Tax=Oribacterium sp. WCC10 TaxID=1855343 RepID=UPI0008EC58E8|nr:putative 7-carboxy-7-deazaguanine synthase QueE [Oribacterium sp. WCC10]SFG20348.1 7-carboxy-7-deazaguanine synthase [Oribacterium sp. WCC10]